MGTELTTQQPNEIATTQPATDINALMAMALTSKDVTPEKLAALFDLKVKVDARDAEAEFNRSFARLQMALPRVQKNGTIDMRDKGSMKFARWEDVDTAIRPILAEHGFVLSFSSEPVPSGVLMVCTLTHVGGHAKQSKMQLPPDAGAGRNGLQAIGSSRSYGKRYLALDILNIVTEGADNDGKTAEPISREQVDQIRDILTEMGTTPNDGRVLKWLKDRFGADSITRIQRPHFQEVIDGLEEKRRARQ